MRDLAELRLMVHHPMSSLSNALETTMKSDSELRSEVRDEVTRQRGSRTDDIDIQALEGVVTLTGNVQSDPEKWSLRDAITAIPGVERLIDETMIVPAPSIPTSAAADVARPWFPAD